MLTKKIIKIGTSKGLIISSDILKLLDMDEAGTEVSLDVSSDGKLMITKLIYKEE